MLEGIVRGKRQPPRIVVYGPPKVGKSTLGADTPAPVFITTEEGVDNLPVDQFSVAVNWLSFLANVKKVAEGKHDYRTLVIDTINGAADLAAESVCQEMFGGDWGPKGFGGYARGWAAVSESMRELLPMLDACRSRGMVVLLLAHTGVTTVKNPVSGDYQKFTPDLDKRVWAKLIAWADIILRADYEYSKAEIDGQRRIVSNSTRILYASGSAVEDAGTRVGFSLPETLPLSWASIEENLGQDAAIGKDIAARWNLFSSEQAAKALAYLGISDVEEIDGADFAKAKVVLNRLLTKEQENG